ncbi:MAG TPA: MBL fold metallo-hydrolase [Deltaproteobacteria bacterium]|jgi:glyoxylase-like metal-dependent hydrolase (beta-lactamase superfamily II)|nr:MBL fold metallo-hydrolase [Deltaproteobacteria bacterium]
MRFRKPGKIDSKLWYLGAEESGIYLLRGRHGTVLINGGMSYILPDVITQMREFGIDPGEITKFLILHSHFDHVGVVPYFKRNYPVIEVLASEAAIKTFEKPKAIELINSYNQSSAGERNESLKGFDLEWRDDIEPLPVREGDIIDLGQVALKIYETPGHSNCSISAYEPDEGVLFASDAMGIPFSDKLFPSMNTNIDQFLNSLEKLRPLKVNVFCADHYGYITGDEAERIVSETIKEALRLKTLMYDTFRRNPLDIDAAAREITSSFYQQMPGYCISPEILEGVFKQMFRYIAKSLQAQR